VAGIVAGVAIAAGRGAGVEQASTLFEFVEAQSKKRPRWRSINATHSFGLGTNNSARASGGNGDLRIIACPAVAVEDRTRARFSWCLKANTALAFAPLPCRLFGDLENALEVFAGTGTLALLLDLAQRLADQVLRKNRFFLV